MNRRRVILSVALLAALAAGCDMFQTKPPELAVDAYAQAQQRMGLGDYPGAAALLADFVGRKPTDRYASDAWLLLGDCRVQMKDWPGAESAYAQAAAKPRTTVISARASAGLGDVFAVQMNTTRAIEAWEDALRTGEFYVDAPRILLALGRTYLGQGNWLMGRDRLGRIVKRYPNSVQAPEARDVLSQPGDVYSVDLGLFATRAEAIGFIEGAQKKGVRNLRIVERWKPAAPGPSGAAFEPGPDRPFAVRTGLFVSRDAAAAEADRLKSITPDAAVFP